MTKINLNVLFLCTGNYYRSRFAEHLFNHYARDCKFPWRAFSRGLATYLVPKNAGPISPHTLEGLASRGIAEVDARSPITLSEQDLAVAHHIVALKHAEHHPLMSQKFPDWIDRVEYWHVHDVDEATPEEALPQIETAVLELLERLAERSHS
jgi:protein-tyrosine phosphatase